MRAPTARRVLVSLVSLILFVAVCAIGCHRPHGRGAAKRRDPLHGQLGARIISPEKFQPIVAWMRGLAAGEGAASAPPIARRTAGARVFVSYFVPGAGPLVGTGLGVTLADSLVQATRSATAGVDRETLASARISIEVVAFASPRPATLDDPETFGREGFAFARAGDGSHLGFVLGSELATRGLLGEDEGGPLLERDRFEALLRLRYGAPCDDCQITTFSTVGFVEARPGGPLAPLRANRLPRPGVDDVTVDSLRTHLRLAAAHLARSVQADGRFDYLYDALADVVDDESYNWLRHAGSTAALFAAYGELRDPTILDAARRARDRLERHLRVAVAFGTSEDDVEHGASYLPAESNPLGPIGGTGLTLLAFAAEVEATGDRTHLPRLRSLGRFLLHQLADDGHFQPFSPDGAPGEVVDVLYYPGEAMLGLMRLHAVDPDARWLDAAARAAHHRLDAPYATKKGHLRDYWFSLALCELVRHRPEPGFISRVFAIAEQTMRDQDDDEDRLVSGKGAFASLPNPSPTGTSLEAYAADVELSRRLARDAFELRAYGLRAATLLFWDQLDETTAYYVKNLPRALGGVRGIPWGGVTRIDDDQHVMMGYLGLLRVLRASP